MDIKYVSNKSKFIDLDAARPRFMNMETVYQLLSEAGVHHPEVVIVAIMQTPITLDKPTRVPAAAISIKKYNVEYKKGLWSIQGVQCGLQEATEMLTKRGLSLEQALRTLAFAIDMYHSNK